MPENKPLEMALKNAKHVSEKSINELRGLTRKLLEAREAYAPWEDVPALAVDQPAHRRMDAIPGRVQIDLADAVSGVQVWLDRNELLTEPQGWTRYPEGADSALAVLRLVIARPRDKAALQMTQNAMRLLGGKCDTKAMLKPKEYALMLLGTTNLTVSEIAKKCEVSRQTLYGWPETSRAINMRKSKPTYFRRGRIENGEIEAVDEHKDDE